MLHIKGTVALALTIDNRGEVVCVQSISGHPLIIGATIESVKRWKFHPYVLQGLRKDFCGKIAISYQATEHAVKYKVIDAP
jgi:outer membrane biosynthesis protein TonB